MSRLRAFFVEEATTCLADLRAALEAPVPDPVAAHAAARRLRGSAQVARYRRFADIAGSLERRLKPVARGDDGWDPGLGRAAARALESLARGVEAVENGRMEPNDGAQSMEDHAGADAAGEEIVPMQALEYRGQAALERALVLRESLEDAIVADEPAGPILDELFDLIRLGTK